MKNAVVPYALIAVLGIVAVIIISVIGLNNQAEIAEGEDEGEETEQVENGGEEGGETAGGDADEIFQNNCAMCHGADLTGGGGPDLTAVGASYSADDIKEIIQNGKGAMPPVQAVQGEELDALAEWLSEKQ
ncbi:MULTISPECIES: c-type cytochrome [Oceanobacillus]|uniref:Cytochrome c domain-containing protein n=1 Tax=Oceanobacillus indicireducens TaxID=1004261 RepID=A0A917Y532_9BACI|nr:MULTISPECIES: cytochrome c [Oceanobacillus]GGN66142.1 hypothetical protein GCM10007971_35740 [Oceanobacillus indicireducens]